MLPSFLIIGAAKAATTAVWSTLNEHPDVFFPAQKETNYLLGGEWSRRGVGWYESLYKGAGAAAQRGEASPSYSMFPMFRDVPERAAALMPEARVVYMIRHPVHRMVSHWAQATAAGHEHRPLPEAVIWGSSYYFTSCYGLQLSRWAQAFPRDSLLVVRSEDLAEHPERTLDRILTHIKLDPGWRPSDVNRRLNALEEKLRVPRPVRVLSGTLRGAGLEHAAVRLANRTPFKRRVGLVKRYRKSELELPGDVAAALLECFRTDFRLLREFSGDLDLYGIA